MPPPGRVRSGSTGDGAGAQARPRLRAGAAGAVAGFGAAFLGQHVLSTSGTLLHQGLSELPFLLLALVLVYGGYWLLDSDLDTRRVGRVAAWSAAGLVGLLAVALWLRPLGAGPEPVLQLTADVGTVGAAAGLLVGLETERRSPRAGTDPRFEHFNRQLRHHLLNGAAVIKGHAELLVETDGPDPEAASIIRSRADELADAARNVATLGLAATGELGSGPVDVAPVIAAAVARVERERPRAELTVDLDAPDRVLGNDELGTAFAALLRAAVDEAEDGAVRVSTVSTASMLEVRVDYEGPPPAGLGGANAAGEGELCIHLARTLVAAAEGRVVGPTPTGFAVRLHVA